MDNEEPDLGSLRVIPLTPKDTERLESFIKDQLVQVGELPENADVIFEGLFLHEDCQDPELGQKYTVKVVARWLIYKSVGGRQPGEYVLRPQWDGCDLCSHVFASGLAAAGVNLPK